MGARSSKINPGESCSQNKFSEEGKIKENKNYEAKIENKANEDAFLDDENKDSPLSQRTVGPPLHLITPKSSFAEAVSFARGDQVMGNFAGEGEWYPGVISRCHADGSYDIAYDDGDLEKRIDVALIKPKPRLLRGHSVSKTPETSPSEDKDKPSKTPSPKKSPGLSNSVVLKPLSGFGVKSNTDTLVLPKKRELKPIKLHAPRRNLGFEEYGEYDGSLDFKPRTTSQPVKKVDKGNDDDDDEFAMMDKQDEEKHLVKSMLSGEHSNSAVIKNLFKEESRNNLLDDAKYPLVSGPSTKDILSRSEKENCASNEKEQINISESPSSLQHIEPERDPLSKENSDSVDNNNEKATGTTLSTGCSTTSPCLMDSIDITSNVHDNITVNDNSNEASPAIMSGAEKNDIWSEDIFGMRIQRVDSVESLDGRNEVDKLDCRDLSVDQTCDATEFVSEYDSRTNSFYNTSAAEQSQSDSFYVPNHSKNEWGYSDQSHTISSDHAVQNGWNEIDSSYLSSPHVDAGHFDSGWTLCYTADGIPYYYSYETQESRWEMPQNHSETNNHDSCQSSPGVPRPHTSANMSTKHVSTGIAQSKYELARALNSNKCQSTLHLTNLLENENEEDDAPYDLGLGTAGLGFGIQPLKKVSSASELNDAPDGSPSKSKNLKRPKSMATMRRKKKKEKNQHNPDQENIATTNVQY